VNEGVNISLRGQISPLEARGEVKNGPLAGSYKFNSLLPGYVRGVAALMIIGILTDIFGTLCTGLGLRSTDPNKKYKYYRVAIYALLVARK
jgi:hypothetical protein